MIVGIVVAGDRDVREPAFPDTSGFPSPPGLSVSGIRDEVLGFRRPSAWIIGCLLCEVRVINGSRDSGLARSRPAFVGGQRVGEKHVGEAPTTRLEHGAAALEGSSSRRLASVAVVPCRGEPGLGCVAADDERAGRRADAHGADDALVDGSEIEPSDRLEVGEARSDLVSNGLFAVAVVFDEESLAGLTVLAPSDAGPYLFAGSGRALLGVDGVEPVAPPPILFETGIARPERCHCRVVSPS